MRIGCYAASNERFIPCNKPRAAESLEATRACINFENSKGNLIGVLLLAGSGWAVGALHHDAVHVTWMTVMQCAIEYWMMVVMPSISGVHARGACGYRTGGRQTGAMDRDPGGGASAGY